MVEVVRDGRSKMVASCLYPVEQGVKVLTNSKRVIDSRKTVIELLLALCPSSKVIQDMAHQLGVEKTEWAAKDEKNECILCGLCVRACSEIVGVNAISLVNRGINREVSTPFHDVAKTCIGCGSCHYICPTGAVKMKDVDGIRKLPNWNAEFKLIPCKKCGNYFATDAQIEYIRKILGTDETIELCSSCRGI
jgi:NADH dehydrogenase/NADH:ubiquinone oxidoreductase subunit G